jgi:hypothetical protein
MHSAPRIKLALVKKMNGLLRLNWAMNLTNEKNLPLTSSQKKNA